MVNDNDRPEFYRGDTEVISNVKAKKQSTNQINNIPSVTLENTITCSASAPGKLILFGEHAVVHSKPAIAASLSNLRIRTSVQTRRDGKILIQMPDLHLFLELDAEDVNTCKKGEDIRHYLDTRFTSSSASIETSALMALVPLIYLIQMIVPAVLCKEIGLSVYISSTELPVGAGLGSSAAFSVATSAALLQLCEHMTSSLPMIKKPTDKELELINHYAYLSEQLIHGSPSGIDNTISCFGGAVYFQKEPLLREVIKDFPDNLTIMLTHTTIPRSTKILVSKVREKKDQYPLVIEGIFESIAGISRQFLQEASSITYTRLSYLVQTNQLLLQALGVSHSAIENICAFTQQYGIASKLTGAGGGGCVVSFLPDKECGYEVKRELEKKFKLPCWITTIGGEGVVYEEMKDEEMNKLLSKHSMRKRNDDVKRYYRNAVIGSFVAVGISGLFWRFGRKR